jgi:hypothetical protein
MRSYSNGSGACNGGAGVSNDSKRQRHLPVFEEILKPVHWWYLV